MDPDGKESVVQWNSSCIDKLATKLATVYCDRLLSSHSSNLIRAAFVLLSNKIFLLRQFCAGATAAF